jgi:DUF4097 and DUF4098 domain-containing protein YvlB
MQRSSITALITGIILSIAVAAPAQESAVDRLTVELTDPGKPAFLTVGLVNGGITVSGYDGKEVVVEAKARLKKISKSGKGTGKSSGMTRLQVNSSSLSVEEYRNKIEIDTDSWAKPVDLVIKVPRKTSLKLSCVNSGDIKVDNITGDIEVSNVNGAVTCLNISGSVLANAHNGDVIVTLTGIDPEKDMSFSSFNGDVDVTFPASLKAKVKLKTTQGEIYTDFEVEEIESPERVVHKNQRESGGKYQVSIDRAFWGIINGGGQELQFSNYNGDIYIRKQK